MSAWGRIEQQSLGNGVNSRAGFEATTGRTVSLNAGPGSSSSVLEHGYAWDSMNNLAYRADNIGDGVAGAVSPGAIPATDAASNPATISSVTLNKLEYWHKDHLVSLAATSDHAGSVTARYAYDPFGKRRYINGSYDEFGAIVIDWSAATNAGTDLGFTGHEHLDDIGLIHTNGRIFDPNLALFLQTDPHIQQPDNLQNYNRYASCFNNPLTGTY